MLRRIAALGRRATSPARTTPRAPARPSPFELVRHTRQMLRHRQVAQAQSLVDAALSTSDPSPAAHLAAGLVAHHRRLYERAMHHFRLAEEHALRVTPVAYVESLFRVDPELAVARTREWLDSPPATIRARTWHTILRYVFAHGDTALRHAVHERLVESYTGDEERWPGGAAEIAWLERWRTAGRHEPAPRPDGRVPFAVMDYVQPGKGKASQNIGDHVQTLASLGHVARHQALRFHGEDPELVALVEELQSRVRPELRRADVTADVHLHRVDRDGSTFQTFPEGTWLLQFGWHMHDLAGTGIWDFPLHPNLRPIFVSFHCNKRGLLTAEALEYLRAHGPVGCRDWTTVDLLLSLDVPAFFSGCLTTTVSTVFPDLDESPAPATVYVDAVRQPVPEGAENIRQSYRAVKDRTFVENVREAVRLLEWYRRDFTHVVTKRLHCYLPATSLGLDVDFQPANNADVRFNGLFRLDHEQFEEIRTQMLARLEPVLGAVFAGRPEGEVYAVWRETVAPEVERARARHEEMQPLPAPAVPAAQLAALVAVGSVAPVAVGAAPKGADVVLLPTAGELPHVARAVQAIDAAAAGPVRVWLVGAGLDQVPEPALSATTTVQRVATGDLAGADGVPGGRDLASVLLPHLLPDVDRAVVLPVDGIALADVAELARLDLRGHPLAARHTSRESSSGFGILYRAARRLDDRPDVAYEFYRRIHARHVFDFDAYDTAVLVLDLAELRRRGFADEALAWMRDFRLDAPAVWHLFTGPDRLELDPAWDHVPTRDIPGDARLVHWADAVKPWDEPYVARQELWLGEVGTSQRSAS